MIDTTSQEPRAISISSVQDVDRYMSMISEAAQSAHEWISHQTSDPINFLKSIKFEKKGYHPITHHPLNLIEQINQTWTFTVALTATRFLLEKHPEADGFELAPGACASQALDIMSRADGIVGAETFAATSPKSNNKLQKDLTKMASRSELIRYVFFASPKYSRTERRPQFEAGGVQVWSLEI